MYTKEPIPSNNGQFSILDPDGDYVCMVNSEAEADTLLSHLNR